MTESFWCLYYVCSVYDLNSHNYRIYNDKYITKKVLKVKSHGDPPWVPKTPDPRKLTRRGVTVQTTPPPSKTLEKWESYHGDHQGPPTDPPWVPKTPDLVLGTHSTSMYVYMT